MLEDSNAFSLFISHSIFAEFLLNYYPKIKTLWLVDLLKNGNVSTSSEFLLGATSLVGYFHGAFWSLLDSAKPPGVS